MTLLQIISGTLSIPFSLSLSLALKSFYFYFPYASTDTKIGKGYVETFSEEYMYVYDIEKTPQNQ